MAIFDTLDTRKVYANAQRTTGTAPNFEVSFDLAPSAYFDGMTLDFIAHESFSTLYNATLNVNGLGAKAIKVPVLASNFRSLNYYEINVGGGYRVTYNEPADCFFLHNPNYGTETNFTPTWGVSDAGPISLNTNYDTNYRWMGPRILMVRTYCTLNLSNGTSQITFALPFRADGDDRIMVGSGYVSAMSGYGTYYVLPLIYSDLQSVRIYPDISIGTSFPADSNFVCVFNIQYNVDRDYLP